MEDNGKYWFSKAIPILQSGELSQKNIEGYFLVRTEKEKELFLSRENKDIYAPKYPYYK